MNITFGIVTSSPVDRLLYIFNSIIDDANKNPIGNIEILVVGGNLDMTSENYRFISFDEAKRPNWITKKKNIITKEAKYDNIVYMHDYIKILPGWFNSMDKFGENWDILMTKVYNADYSRFRDWTLWPHDLDHVWGPDTRECLIPYDKNFSKIMYISGAYWIAKRKVMEEFPLNETLCWGESEDVEWSKRVRKKYNFTMNSNSSVQSAKQKERVFSEITPEKLKIVETYYESL